MKEKSQHLSTSLSEQNKDTNNQVQKVIDLDNEFHLSVVADEPENIEQIEENTVKLLSKDDAIIFNHIKNAGIIKNLLTDKYEIGDKLLEDTHINMIAINTRVEQSRISSTRVFEIINSSLTPSYHPFKEFIEHLKGMPLKIGKIQEVFDCLILDNHHRDYKERVIKKWFGSIMGTLMGSYSVMTFVLIGTQNIGKTTFFRGLLPEMLNKYFVESAIKEDKDVMSLMCCNLICYDDEFTGKNKTEASVYKKMSSASDFTFRRPYGRIDITRPRTAVLCGSANEPDVISDHTGNRRILPARVISIDMKSFLAINKDEFYRELFELHQANPFWWHLTSDDISFMNADTTANTSIDEYEERAIRYTKSDPEGFVSTTEVERHIYNNDYSYKSNPHKLGRALTRLYGDSHVQSVNGKSIRGYKLTLITENNR